MRADIPFDPAKPASFIIPPTIGRKVWYWARNEPEMHIADSRTPCDATVVYVWSDHCVNLAVRDHDGIGYRRHSVVLIQADEELPNSNHATWMPYQKGQAAKHA